MSLEREVFGEDVPEHTLVVDFKQIEYKGERYFRAIDVAEVMESLGQYKTARHIRELVL